MKPTLAGRLQLPLPKPPAWVFPPSLVRIFWLQVIETATETGRFFFFFSSFKWEFWACGTERSRDRFNSEFSPLAQLTFGTRWFFVFYSCPGHYGVWTASLLPTHPMPGAPQSWQPQMPQYPWEQDSLWSSWFQTQLDPGPSNSVTKICPPLHLSILPSLLLVFFLKSPHLGTKMVAAALD